MSIPPFTVCIPSGGSGTRMRSSLPKQYLPIAGVPLLLHTLAVFDALPSCRHIVIAADDVQQVRMLLAGHTIATPCDVVAGGPTRQESVRNALAAADPGIPALVHDAARPCILAGDVERLRVAIGAGRFAILAAPATDSIRLVEDGVITGAMDRSTLWHAQTPQGGPSGVLFECIDAAIREGVILTDEAAALTRMGHTVHVVEGARWNIKVTTPEDLAICELILRRQGRIA